MKKGVLLALFLALSIAPLGTAVQSPPKSKIDAFLSALRSARSIEEVAAAARRAGLTEADKPALRKALNEPEYLEKLKALFPRKGPDPKPDPALGQALIRKLEAEQDQLVLRLTRQARNKSGSRTAAPIADAKRRAVPVSKGSARTQAASGAPAGPGGSSWIMSTTIPASIGHRMVVTGQGFGAVQGRVVIRLDREIVECPVERWNDKEIVTTLAPELGERVGNAGRQATLWVKLAGRETGPTAEIRLSLGNMRIASLSAGEIHPGQELRIDGSFFLDAQGTVELFYPPRGSLPHGLRILDWADGSILVSLDAGIEGIRENSCTLRVRNAAGQEASASILFKPTLVVETLHGGHFHIDRLDLSYTFDMVLNFFGERKEYTAFEGILLGNQWTVLSGHLEVDGAGAGHGADILRQPARGSNRPEFSFVYWADGFARVYVHPYAIIRGPKGLRY